MSRWRESRMQELDQLTASLRDRVDAWERQLRTVERDVYRRNDNSNGDQQT